MLIPLILGAVALGLLAFSRTSTAAPAPPQPAMPPPLPGTAPRADAYAPPPEPQAPPSDEAPLPGRPATGPSPAQLRTHAEVKSIDKALQRLAAGARLDRATGTALVARIERVVPLVLSQGVTTTILPSGEVRTSEQIVAVLRQNADVIRRTIGLPAAPTPAPGRGRPARRRAPAPPTPGQVPIPEPAPVASRTPEAGPPVPMRVTDALTQPDVDSSEVEAALDLASQGGHAPQADLLRRKLAALREARQVMLALGQTVPASDLDAARASAERTIASLREWNQPSITRRLQEFLGRAAAMQAENQARAQQVTAQVSAQDPEVRSIVAELVALEEAKRAAISRGDAASLAPLVARYRAVAGRLRALIPGSVLRSTGRDWGANELADVMETTAETIRGTISRVAPGTPIPTSALPAPPPAPGTGPVVTRISPEEAAPPIEPSAAPAEGIAALALRASVNIARSQRGRYDSALLRQFQQAAGIDVDGKFGPGTREALAAAGVPLARLPARTLYWSAAPPPAPARAQAAQPSVRRPSDPRDNPLSAWPGSASQRQGG